MNLEKKLITKNYSKGVTIKPKYIVIHETGNFAKGADADSHYNYDNAGSSAHFVCDKDKVIQLLELNQRAWHVGDNKGHSDITNSNSIGIEICVNADGNYKKARENCIELVRWLLKQTGLSIDSVVRHYDASGKRCPTKMIDNPQLWIDFKEAIKVAKVEEYTEIEHIVWDLNHRGIISNTELWTKKLTEDSDAYWLARKALQYIRERD